MATALDYGHVLVVAKSTGLSLGTIGSLVLGAMLATVGGILTELWKQRRSTRGAARLVYHELLLNYGIILSLRMGDVPAKELSSRLRFSAWEAHSDQLALVGEFSQYTKAWGVVQAMVALASPDAQGPSRAALDAVLDSIQDLIGELDEVAGGGGTSMADAPRMRMLADLPRSQRIVIWRKFEAEGRGSPSPDDWLRSCVAAAVADQVEGSSEQAGTSRASAAEQAVDERSGREGSV